MRNLCGFLFLAAILSGCSASSRPSAQQGAMTSTTTLTTPTRSVAPTRPAFAKMPDRGNLVMYTPRGVRKDGAYTWHRVNLSEAHALAALESGMLHLTTPSGEGLDFAYRRHAEHPNGDWTFVGSLRTGQAADEVVLTFGRDAAFGTIAQGSGRPPLRLTMRDGQAWMIETDSRQLVRYAGMLTPEGVSDALVPSAKGPAQDPNDQAPRHMMAAASTASASAPTAPVIDLLLGYTPGYVQALGSEASAQTRLFHLVELTNQAYVNSQVPGRLRIVKLLKVGFTDKSSNLDTLNKLGASGADAEPAFAELRQARETYGADLVSLVRKFEMNDQGGCGIAWMLGGGRQPITQTTSMWAYSVVSDGPFINEQGQSIYCRDDAMAHEIGHNLGANHDIATSTRGDVLEYGAYDYSFGQKTDLTTGNFYTVMTYNNTDQVGYRIFSTPRSTFCGGRACGVENKVDNARTIEQTMPIISAFRASVVSDADLPQAPAVPQESGGIRAISCGAYPAGP